MSPSLKGYAASAFCSPMKYIVLVGSKSLLLGTLKGTILLFDIQLEQHLGDAIDNKYK